MRAAAAPAIACVWWRFARPGLRPRGAFGGIWSRLPVSFGIGMLWGLSYGSAVRSAVEGSVSCWRGRVGRIVELGVGGGALSDGLAERWGVDWLGIDSDERRACRVSPACGSVWICDVREFLAYRSGDLVVSSLPVAALPVWAPESVGLPFVQVRNRYVGPALRRVLRGSGLSVAGLRRRSAGCLVEVYAGVLGVGLG